MFSMHFWVALWSCTSPHTVDVQTDALCPRCPCENTLKLHSSWKTKPFSQHRVSLFHALTRLCLERVLRYSYPLSLQQYPGCFQLVWALLQFLGVHCTVRRTVCSQFTAFVVSPYQGPADYCRDSDLWLSKSRSLDSLAERSGVIWMFLSLCMCKLVEKQSRRFHYMRSAFSNIKFLSFHLFSLLISSAGPVEVSTFVSPTHLHDRASLAISWHLFVLC